MPITLEQFAQSIEKLATSAQVIEKLNASMSRASLPAPHRAEGCAECAERRLSLADGQGEGNEKKVGRMAYRLNELADAVGLSTRYLRGEIQSGRLLARKFGSATLVLHADAVNWLKAHPPLNGRADADA